MNNYSGGGGGVRGKLYFKQPSLPTTELSRTQMDFLKKNQEYHC